MRWVVQTSSNTSKSKPNSCKHTAQPKFRKCPQDFSPEQSVMSCRSRGRVWGHPSCKPRGTNTSYCRLPRPARTTSDQTRGGTALRHQPHASTCRTIPLSTMSARKPSHRQRGRQRYRAVPDAGIYPQARQRGARERTRQHGLARAEGSREHVNQEPSYQENQDKHE